MVKSGTRNKSGPGQSCPVTTSTWTFVAHLGSVNIRKARKGGSSKPQRRSPGEKAKLAMFTEVRILRIQLVWHQRPLVTLGTVISMECHSGGGTQYE